MQTSPTVTPLTERILLAVLFITVLASSIAMIEPSPHDGLMGLLAFTCLIAGVRFDRTLVTPLVLLTVWNVAGLMSLTRVLDEEKTIQYALTSVYLGIATLVFALIFATNTMPRVTVMRVAYVMTAVFAALLGIAGYFNLFPGADMFAPTGRAMGSFKDPNVYGPFLIWPMLFIIHRMLTRAIRLADTIVLAILLFGLLLSFSRGAWFHFAVSTMVLLTIAFLTVPDQKARLRIFALSAFGVVLLAGLLTVLLSLDAIGDMFEQRAQLIQSYDVGSGGRFRLQEIAVGAVLNFPNGMGPLEFGRVHGQQQHNVYLQAFLVYGWVGAMAYFLLLFATLWVGLRASFIRTPWQPYVIAALGAMVGEIVEGFVIDTDHWRHFFLLLGMIWGLAAASFRLRRQEHALPPTAWAGYAPR